MTIGDAAGSLFGGKRGLLSNYPSDVVAVINGKPVTKADLLQAKQERQRRILAIRMLADHPITRPCFVWTFYIDGFIKGGWWLYVKTSRKHWCINATGLYSHFILQIMRMFPCGYLPMIENFRPWKAAFADAYHYPTRKRPTRQGMIVARAKVDCNGSLLDITPLKESASVRRRLRE